MISPGMSLFCVRALNCLQNSMMLTCAWPNAGPTGGAGVALPASICNFTWVCTFLIGGIAITFLRSAQKRAPKTIHKGTPTGTAPNFFFFLAKLEFDGRRPPKDRHHHLERLAVLIDLVDHA